MIGAIAGDIVGSIYERANIKTKEFQLFSDRCFFTDDSILTIALADSILTGTPYAENLKKFYRLYPDGGYGGSFHRWARSVDSKPYNSWGNGAAMRISAVGYAFDDLGTVLAKAEEYTAITHNHPEGIKGGQSVAVAIFLARSGKTKTEIRQYIEKQFGYDLSRHVDEIRPTYAFDVSSQGTVPQAIRAFLDAADFEDAIRTAISLGGDSDTLACITGGIAQAFYRKVPNEIQKTVYRILDDRLGLITLRFMQKYCEFCCERSALDASLSAIEDEIGEIVNDFPDVHPDPEAPFSPYVFRFTVGDIVYLKTGPAYSDSLAYVSKSVEKNGLPRDVSWIPTEPTVQELASLPMTVVMPIAYHFGYPLYFVSFTHQGQSCQYRFCEAFLTKDKPERTKPKGRVTTRMSPNPTLDVTPIIGSGEGAIPFTFETKGEKKGGIAMGLFKMLFGKKPLSIKEMDKMPPIYGGDAASLKTAATINCASMSTAHRLIDRFISERHGKKDTDWKHGISFFGSGPGIPNYTVRAYVVTTTSGKSHTYYFNEARPMNATKNLMKLTGLMPDDM